jgi:membrane protease YdiL (CAAX protease family)
MNCVIIWRVHPVPLRFRWRSALPGFLPEQPLQFVPLTAAFCLAVCFGRSWLVLPNLETAQAWGLLERDEIYEWVYITRVFSFVLLFAGAGAYVCCLWRLNNPLRKWMFLVVVPAALGVLGGVFVPAFIVASQRRGSVLEKYSPNPLKGFKFPPGTLLLNLGMGFRLALFGLILALVSAWMLRRGSVSLPLRFGPASLPARAEDESDSTRSRQKLFALYVLAFPWLAANFLSLILTPLFNKFIRASSSHDSRTFSDWFSAAQYFLLALVFFLIAAWCLDGQRRQQLREAARIPPAQILGVACLVGIAAFFLPHLIAYSVDRIVWAQHWGIVSTAPDPALYLHIPPLGSYLLFVAIAAGLSEWCWRGCAQPQFIRIFGTARGLFLVGILYGSVQQVSLPRLFSGLPGFFLNFVLMLISGIAWSIVFGWLTIRGGSVWPAAASGAVISILVRASYADTREMIPYHLIRVSLLLFGAVLAFLLLRYSPLNSQSHHPPLAGTSTVSESPY